MNIFGILNGGNNGVDSPSKCYGIYGEFLYYNRNSTTIITSKSVPNTDNNWMTGPVEYGFYHNIFNSDIWLKDWEN